MNNKLFYKNFFNNSINKKEDVLRRESYSFLVCVILDKEIFKKNKDLHIVLDKLNLRTPLKSYLFASRTQLIARLVREFSTMDDIHIRKNIQYFAEYLDLNEINKPQKDEINQKNIEKNLEIINRYRRNRHDK
ncbi:hypothetical protein [Weissella paramesenteroides]|uniref:hypothetical protein n=1 Tax=Weissella paramesenteroides TaxID=1249 RepID=UPI002E7BF868|nr:hypothetical protein [Weissella paramesenteroides]WPQ68416.1 hypothetical protein QRX23_02125 [Weissella paramesenteroides]